MIKINGQEYEFRYSFAAINELTNATGKTIDDTMEALNRMDFRDVGNITHIGLVHGSKKAKSKLALTKEEVEEMIDQDNGETVKGIIAEFGRQVVAWLPKPKEVPNETSQATSQN